MCRIMPAVIGSDNNECFAAQVSGIQLCEEPAKGLIGTERHAELLGGKPSIFVSHTID